MCPPLPTPAIIPLLSLPAATMASPTGYFVQSAYPCDEGSYWTTAYPSTFAGGAPYATIPAADYTGSKGQCVSCPAGTVGVANTFNFTENWCLPAPQGTDAVIRLLLIFIGTLVGGLILWQLIKWQMSKKKVGLMDWLVKVRWIAFVMAHAGIVLKLYESLMKRILD